MSLPTAVEMQNLIESLDYRTKTLPRLTVARLSRAMEMFRVINFREDDDVEDDDLHSTPELSEGSYDVRIPTKSAHDRKVQRGRL